MDKPRMPPGAGLTVTFQVVDGVDKGRVFRDLPVPLTIGREEGNLLRLNDERVSRFHAEVQFESARILTWYDAAYLPGPLFGVCILIALAAAAGIGPARRSGMRAVCLLFGLTALLVTVPDEAISTFDWRYQIPQLVIASLAGGLGIAAFSRRARTGTGGRVPARAVTAPEPVARERDALPVPD